MLDSLHIKNFRCFEDLSIPSLGHVNLIVGKNNVGKTTLLEALHILGNGGLIGTIEQILVNRGLPFVTNSLVFNSAISSTFYIGDAQQTFRVEISINGDEFKLKSIDNFIEKKSIKKFINREHQTINKPLTQEEISSIVNSNTNLWKNKKVSVGRILNLMPSESLPTHLLDDNELVYEFNSLAYDDNGMNTGLNNNIVEWLQIINPHIQDIMVLNIGKTKQPTFFLKVDNVSNNMPLKNMGEGAYRLVRMALFATKVGFFANRDKYGGFLLIDEFENGLHYSIQEAIWEKLFELARQWNIQIFATTHSKDTLQAFTKVAIKNKKVDGELISLGRSAAKSNRGQVIADIYNEDRLTWIVNSGMEVR